MSSLLDPPKRGFTWHDFSYRAKSAFAVLLSLAVLVGGGVFAYGKAKAAYESTFHAHDYTGDGDQQVQIVIPEGASAYRIADMLYAADVIKDPRTFDQVVAANPDDAKRIQSGRYTLLTHLPAQTAFDMLLDQKNMVRTQFTIREGLRNTLVVKLLAQDKPTGLGMSTDDMNAVLKDPSKLGLPDYAKNNAEGFLFPDTYQFSDVGSAQAVFTTMVSRFNQVANQIGLEKNAAAAGVSPRDVVIVASIVEMEVRRDEDRAKVARVLYNRVNQGMPLQLDSTVIYANNVDGTVWTTDEQRQKDSPYNTYLHAGLPPGPISNPGQKSLQAALKPDDGDWLYFVVVNPETGETVFSNTLAEHEAATEQLRAWCDAHPGKCTG